MSKRRSKTESFANAVPDKFTGYGNDHDVNRYFVYVIGPVEGFPCKVGVAKKISDRLLGIQVGNWIELRVHHVCMVYSKRTAFSLEALCKKRHGDLIIRGEWYNETADEMANKLKQIHEEMGPALKTKGKWGQTDTLAMLQ
jgi:hypothetical protein